MEKFTLEQAEEEIAQLRGDLHLLTERVALTDSTDAPVITGGCAAYSSSGQLMYVSGDTNTYDTGRLSLGATGPLTLSSSLQNIPGISCTLGVGTYVIEAQLAINPSTSGGNMSYQGTCSGGLVNLHGRLAFTEIVTNAVVSGCDYVNVGTTYTSTNALGGSDRVTTVRGWAVFTAPGTFAIQAKLSSGAATIQQYPTYMQIFPVT